jgi:hypothetical protein
MSEDTRQTFLVLYTRLSVSKNGREVVLGMLAGAILAADKLGNLDQLLAYLLESCAKYSLHTNPELGDPNFLETLSKENKS